MAGQKFDILPDTSAEDRDLRFRSVENSAPATLTPGQIAHFNEQGYVAPVPVFDNAEITELRAYFDDLLARTLAAGGNSYSISSAHLEHGCVHDILSDSRIVAAVKDLIGDDVIGWGSHFFCKMPGDGKAVAWHQDASYWPLTPSRTVTVWLAIDDADAENACMRFLAGSHHHGHLTWRDSTPEEHNVLNQTVENAEQYGTPASKLSSPLTIDSYTLVRPATSSDFTVSISCSVYAAPYASNAQTSISPNLCPPN